MSVYSQIVFGRKEVSLRCSKFKDGRTALSDDPEEHRGRSRTWHTDENGAILEGLVREDLRTKTHRKTVVLYFTSLGKENCSEGNCTFVKRYDKYLNASTD
jgi:hypothetical protein